MLSFPWRRPRRLADRVAKAREDGVGLYTVEWAVAEEIPLPEDEPEQVPEERASVVLQARSPEALAEAVLEWCRETLGGTRRPMGIANFDLAFAASGVEGARGSFSLSGLSPTELYPGDLFIREVREFLEERGTVSHLAVALFSWGDATHAALSA